MTALVLGATGMLGHQVYRTFAREMEAAGTVRGSAQAVMRSSLFGGGRIFGEVDATDPATVEQVIEAVRPSVVINCIGLVKQRREGVDPVMAIQANALFPHHLATLASRDGFRLIHISTDCVFSGSRGNYAEADPPDAQDLYGRTKALGEVVGGRALTLRTALIGRELERRVSLLEWFLAQEGGAVRGYVNAVLSGVTTTALANELLRLVRGFPDLAGLYHLSADRISKYELLRLARDVFAVNVEIDPEYEFRCDRSLNSARYRRVTGFQPASWRAMLEQLRGSCAT